MFVLGIESSCDDTGVAVYDDKRGLLGHALHSQTLTHQQYGGVVPELASRDHITHVVPLLTEALTQAQIRRQDLDGVAYTAGPGLIGALLVASCFGKALAYGLGIPALAIHHLEAHLLAAKLADESLRFPFVALLVSGGHCQLFAVNGFGDYSLLGESLDDAVGEAFDKTAKLMGIPYPGGPKLASLADACDHTPYQFPRPMVDRPGLDFSFSGLKTHALNTWQNSQKDEQAISHIAKAFQDAVIETLLIKSKRALAQTGYRRLVVAGGVGANLKLRRVFTDWIKEMQGELFFPALEFCTDNGAMIAYAGCMHLLRGDRDADLTVQVRPRWPLGS